MNALLNWLDQQIQNSEKDKYETYSVEEHDHYCGEIEAYQEVQKYVQQTEIDSLTDQVLVSFNKEKQFACDKDYCGGHGIYRIEKNEKIDLYYITCSKHLTWAVRKIVP